MDYFDKQNEQFYDFLNQTFGIQKAKNWDDISKNITQLKIKLTYRYFSKLYPRNYNYLEELKKNKSEFSSIHYGTIKANRIIDEIVRFSLYSEKIIVFHPLQNPSVTNQQIDPGRNPRYWLPDFIDSLYFYIVIQKWVKAGIIKLIINPYEYNLDLRNRIDIEVQQRIFKINQESFFEIAKDSAMDNLAEQFAFMYKNRSKEYIISSLLEIKQPTFNHSEAEKFADKIIDSFSRSNPLYEKLDNSLRSTKMLVPTKGGGPIESIILISEASGANIYTPSETVFYQMKEMGINEFWLKMNHLYSKIPLYFLNNVDTNFALELRKEDRLSGVRQELKKIYKELSSIDIKNIDDTTIRFLQEGFIEEIKKAEAEWKLIKKQAELSRKYWLTANVGIPFITNEISILPMAIGSLAWLYMNEKSASEKTNLYKVKNPISVYVDLKNKRQSFIAQLKNCLF